MKIAYCRQCGTQVVQDSINGSKPVCCPECTPAETANPALIRAKAHGRQPARGPALSGTRRFLASLKAIGLLTVLLIAGVAGATELTIEQPLNRNAYQTNEQIDLSLVRKAAEPLAATDLELKVSGTDGSEMDFTFPLKAAAAPGTTDHLHLNGWLLRPGHYTVTATAYDVLAKTEFDVYSHVRKSSFKLINWGRAQDNLQLGQGEDNLGYNMFYGGYGNDDKANFIRAGVDFMSCCTMSGAHQMDMRGECDWSDPYVIRGGTERVVRRAFVDRTRPNVFGVHFYDEPGLTWTKNEAGQMTPHGVPSQLRAYKSAFDTDAPNALKIKADNPSDVEKWTHWARWKLGFMDAAWKEAQFGVSEVRPDYVSVTQSQYGFSAFADGYYFNVVRCMPVVSGHGGYDDYGLGYFNPSLTLELARARTFDKPNWYLPTWYGNTPPDRFRLEQYLSFMTNIQGMMSPPDLEPGDPQKSVAAKAIVETNHLMGKLGTIFTTMPVTRPPVAMLYSLSHLIHKQTTDMNMNYAHQDPHGANLYFTYLAGKLIQQQFLTVVEEDIVDGTLAANHKAIVLTSITYLDPPVIANLENFAANGGLVLMTSDCKVAIKGAINLDVVPALPDQAKIDALNKAGQGKEAGQYMTVGKYMKGATPLALAIKKELDKAGIQPVFDCDQQGITATRQADGDIEYLFAVNASYDYKKGGMNDITSAVANIGIPADGRPVYDAIHGGLVEEFKADGKVLKGEFRFGPGQMRVFARTARPIGGVRVMTPPVRNDFTAKEEPLHADVSAVVADNAGGVLSGSAPLNILLIDPLGATRYNVYRATKNGAFAMSFPLGLNDPAGEWKVVVRELLSNTEGVASFKLNKVANAGALAGATPRAIHFGADRDNLHRFFRSHQDVTIVKGSAPFENAAAERLAAIVKPWDVRCKIVDAKDAAKPRSLSAGEAPTWVGLAPGGAKPGDANPIEFVGFKVEGPVVLLGTPEDNPIIEYLQKQRFLPYAPKKDAFPGTGRGMLSWQLGGVGLGQESVTLIAYDEAGLKEAVGSLYEAMAGIEPLTPLDLPKQATIKPASTIPGKAGSASVAWTVTLPDRVNAIKAMPNNQVEVVTNDGNIATLDASGKVLSKRAAENTDAPSAAAAAVDLKALNIPATKLVKTAVKSNDLTAIAYWGGTIEICDAAGAKTRHDFPQDVEAVVWLDKQLVVGLADGRVCALAIK